MAERTNSDNRLEISAASPYQISKDFHSSDNAIPLSPQWLLPKPGESKPGIGTGENHVISSPPYGNRSETVKTSGNGEDLHDSHKRKDVFRPSMLDSESGRRDRWRDEERDTKSSIRKDRWRDGDKDYGDARRADRWTENLSTRHFGEARRGTSDRWNDSGNRETNHDQRRESKWNTRWGPDDKESEGLREKWGDSGKDGETHGLSHISNHGKDEKEGDHYRPWRPNSSQSRGRVDPPHQQNLTPNKQISTFSYGRSRGENTPPTYTLGRGRVGASGSSMNSISSYSAYSGPALDKVESGHGEPDLFRYSRIKLLDVYRVTDALMSRKLVDNFVQVPNLTQDQPLEPLAFGSPNSEELAILNGIDKGEVVSSSVPQVPKDGRSSTDFTHARRMKIGSALLQDKGEDGGAYRTVDEVLISKESTLEGDSSVHPGAVWRATASEHSNSLLQDGKEMFHDTRSRSLDVGWSHHSKDPHNQWENSLSFSSDVKDVAKWQTSDDPVVKRQPPGIMDSEFETRRVPQVSPEELSLFYKDPQGQIQGPFKGIDIIGWFEAGYFGIDLPVRVENAAPDLPWLSLGDAMPHLRAKARPPPGFSAPKLNDFTDASAASARQTSSTCGSVHGGLSEMEIMRNDPRLRQSSNTEAENRFLESLMSGNKSSPPLDSLTLSEGFQGLIGNNTANLGPSGVDSGNNLYLLAKRMSIERQRSLPNPYPYWPGRDAASTVSKSDIVPDAPVHSKLLSSVSDNSHQPQSQNADLLSIIQGLSDRSSGGLNNGVASWPNYPVQSSLDTFPNKIDLHHDQNLPQVPFGIQPQRLQAQNQLSLSNLVAQSVDNPSGILTADKLLSSGLPQDPQMLNMLQQQYLLQLHSQATAPAQQMSLLDKFLLLKQKHEEQQQQLLRQQQQQQLISQVLQEHQSHQCFSESSYGQLQGGGIPIGNLHVDPSPLQPSQEIFPMSSQTPISSLQDELVTNLNLPLQVTEETSHNVSSEASVHLPHQLFGSISRQKSWGPSIPEQINKMHQDSFPATTSVESSLLCEENRSKEELLQRSLSASDYTSKSAERMPDDRTDNIVMAGTPKYTELSASVPHVVPGVSVLAAASFGTELPAATDLDSDVKLLSDNAIEEKQVEGEKSVVEPSMSDVKGIDVREPKKASEKKSKKQKSSKSQSSDQAKGLLQKNLPLQQSKQSEAEKLNVSDMKLGEDNQLRTATKEAADDHELNALPSIVPGSFTERVLEGDLNNVSSVSRQSTELHAGQRAWKPAPGFKAKSLLEIQQEEQRKAQSEMLVTEITTSVNTLGLSTPWAGVVANPDSVRVSTETQREVVNAEYLGKSDTSQNSKSKKSQLHDLLAEEVLKKSSERDDEAPDIMSSSQNTGVHSESIDDDNFIEAKDTKRSRKKSTKSKVSAAKVSMSTSSSDVPIASSPLEKGKSSRLVQQEKEVLPAIPAGPSLGDFVLWKGESASPSPSLAWSTESGRVPKPASLRDILKEEEKKGSYGIQGNQVPTLKSQPSIAARTTAPSWSTSASSPSKDASPIQINSHAASQSKYKVDDDLFWGPIEQSKQETKQSDFPQLASQGSWGSKNILAKGNSPGQLTRQKSASGRPTEKSLSSSPASSQSLLKLKRDAMTKHSEAMDFRDWCKNECVRLIGTKDTSFLEFCLKQSRSEAETLLIENLGQYDPDHEFIDKFLNYKELLPSDVLEIAFQSRNDRKVPGFSAGDMNFGNAEDLDHNFVSEGSSKGGGKKKGKKGKKVSPSVLGFNVVSNRIMMGEIQTVED